MAKEEVSALEKKLKMEKKVIWHELKPELRKKVFAFGEEYKGFTTRNKTEREVVREMVAEAKKNGFKPIEKVKQAEPGLKVYMVNRDKSVAFAVLGKEPIEEGIAIVASHIDSPRLDLKQNPLYEDKDTELALLKTHYYGGIKKYQWVNTPLAIHGRVVLENGESVDIVLGEREDDPIFTVADLLVHLHRKAQGNRKTDEVIKGEELNVLVGSVPLQDKQAKQKVKLWVLDYLNKAYGMIEEDFISAELELVPAGPARDVGFDRSMIAAYGHDDRSCAYPAFRAILDLDKPNKTCIAFMFDKEEIGSEGNTGAQSLFLVSCIGEVLELFKNGYNDHLLRHVLQASKALSSDVNGAVNPTFKDVHEMRNASKMGYGVVLTKFTGRGGKSGSNDANAEFVGLVRRVFNKRKVPWQFGALGKVDEGGGGTVAKFLARYNMEVIDCGPALLSMHSPMEIASKVDIYYTYQGFLAFYEEL